MKLPNVFSNQGYKRAVIIAAVSTLVYGLINLFVIGGDDFVISLNDTVSIPTSIGTALLSLALWNRLKTSRVNRILWGSLLAGWTLWAIAEALWAILDYFSAEIPYPSAADFFWLLGYIPLALGLHTRLREIPLKPNETQRIALWVTSLAVILITVIFVLPPILQSSESARLLEYIIGIAYPVADLILLLIALRLLFFYQGGDYGFGWSLLIVGFVLTTFADLVFAYTTTVGLYYPEGKVNLISALGEALPYNISYLVWLLGIYALYLTLGKPRALNTRPLPKLASNAHILIFTDHADNVLEVSKNFQLVFKAERLSKKTLADILQIPVDEAHSLLDSIRNEGKIIEQALIAINRFDIPQEVFISGIATKNPDGKYSGSNIILRTLFEADYTLDKYLTKEQKYLVSYLQPICRSGEVAEIKKLLFDYYLTYLKQIYNLLLRTGGAQLSLAFVGFLRQTVEEHQWQLQFNPQSLIVDLDYPIEALQEGLPYILEEAKKFASQLTDPHTVETELESLTAKIREGVHLNVAYHTKSVSSLNS